MSRPESNQTGPRRYSYKSNTRRNRTRPRREHKEPASASEVKYLSGFHQKIWGSCIHKSGFIFPNGAYLLVCGLAAPKVSYNIPRLLSKQSKTFTFFSVLLSGVLEVTAGHTRRAGHLLPGERKKMIINLQLSHSSKII